MSNSLAAGSSRQTEARPQEAASWNILPTELRWNIYDYLIPLRPPVLVLGATPFVLPGALCVNRASFQESERARERFWRDTSFVYDMSRLETCTFKPLTTWLLRVPEHVQAQIRHLDLRIDAWKLENLQLRVGRSVKGEFLRSMYGFAELFYRDPRLLSDAAFTMTNATVARRHACPGMTCMAINGRLRMMLRFAKFLRARDEAEDFERSRRQFKEGWQLMDSDIGPAC